MELTRVALPPMLATCRGTVINIASVAGLLPAAGPPTRPKAWVVFFSEGLANWPGTGVGMHAVCPGFVHTEFHQRAGIEMSTLPSALWLMVGRGRRESRRYRQGSGRRHPGDAAKALTTVGRADSRRPRPRHDHQDGTGPWTHTELNTADRAELSGPSFRRLRVVRAGDAVLR